MDLTEPMVCSVRKGAREPTPSYSLCRYLLMEAMVFDFFDVISLIRLVLKNGALFGPLNQCPSASSVFSSSVFSIAFSSERFSY